MPAGQQTSFARTSLFRRFDHYGPLNRYDVLKAVALVTMVIDHLGFYFWGQALWMRAVGRMAFPLFLFLVGYSGKWNVRPDLIICAALPIAIGMVLHYPVFPLNILATIIAVKLLMRIVTRLSLTQETLAALLIACAILGFFTMRCFDYGTFAVLFALCGHVQRTAPQKPFTLVFIGCSLALLTLVEKATFHFHGATTCIAVTAALMDMYLMWRFRPDAAPAAFLPAALRPAVQWLSRNTLPIYTGHIVLFMIVAAWLFPELLGHFRWFY